VSLEEDQSRVRQPNAALVLGMFRRVVVSWAQAWLAAGQTRQTRFSVRRFQKQFARRDGGPAKESQREPLTSPKVSIPFRLLIL